MTPLFENIHNNNLVVVFYLKELKKEGEEIQIPKENIKTLYNKHSQNFIA